MTKRGFAHIPAATRAAHGRLVAQLAVGGRPLIDAPIRAVASSVTAVGLRGKPILHANDLVTQISPVRAEIIGSDTATALGISVKAYAPVLELCRALISAGIDPSAPLEAYRGAILCLRVRTIGEGARVTVRTAGNGSPIFALEGPVGGAGASPTRQTRPAGAEQGADAADALSKRSDTLLAATRALPGRAR
jgi:hypothetical protein